MKSQCVRGERGGEEGGGQTHECMHVTTPSQHTHVHPTTHAHTSTHTCQPCPCYPPSCPSPCCSHHMSSQCLLHTQPTLPFCGGNKATHSQLRTMSIRCSEHTHIRMLYTEQGVTPHTYIAMCTYVHTYMHVNIHTYILYV